MNRKYERYIVEDSPEGPKIILHQTSNTIGFAIIGVIIMFAVWFFGPWGINPKLPMIGFIIIELFVGTLVVVSIFSFGYKWEMTILRDSIREVYGVNLSKMKYNIIPFETMSTLNFVEIRPAYPEGCGVYAPYRIEIMHKDGERVLFSFGFNRLDIAEDFYEFLSNYLQLPKKKLERASE